MMKNACLGMVLLTLAFVTPAAADEARIAQLNSQISAQPQNKNLYSQRAREYAASGNHAAALADLRNSCALEEDADIAELCMMEVVEYAQIHNLPKPF